MSFSEKNTWISLVSTLAIFTYYFFNVWQLVDTAALHASGNADMLLDAIQVLSLEVIFWIVVLEIISHTLFAMGNAKAAAMGADERDKLLALKAGRIGHGVMVTGVMIFIISQLWFRQSHVFGIDLTEVFFTANLLLAVFIVSELVRFTALICYYRQGA